MRRRDVRVIYGALAFVTAFCLVLAIVLAHDHKQLRAEDHERLMQSHVTCLRTIEFGPRLANFFERFGVFTHNEAVAYRKTIPRSCP